VTAFVPPALQEVGKRIGPAGAAMCSSFRKGARTNPASNGAAVHAHTTSNCPERNTLLMKLHNLLITLYASRSPVLTPLSGP
jgi:hypothetical protein